VNLEPDELYDPPLLFMFQHSTLCISYKSPLIYILIHRDIVNLEPDEIVGRRREYVPNVVATLKHHRPIVSVL
jgi:hypothetical protein